MKTLLSRRRPAHAKRPPRIGLVMGAGGITGVAWLAGALEALKAHTGWDPATAQVMTGTSAGSVTATVLASGIDPISLLRYADDKAALDAAIEAATVGRDRRGPAPGWPGSLALGVTGLLSTDPRHRLTSLTGFLPRGLRSTDEIRGLTHAACAGGWPAHTKLWLHACDYRTGQRVTFGRDGAPEAPLADAVAASCAVPAYYRPVEIGGRHYIDGGLWSFANADAVVGEQCDIVLCLSPFASRQRGSLLDTAVVGPVRSATARRLEREAQTLRDSGAQVVMIEPSGEDIRAMGLNLMDRSRSRRVVDAAIASVGETLPRLLDGVDLVSPRPTGVLCAA